MWSTANIESKPNCMIDGGALLFSSSPEFFCNHCETNSVDFAHITWNVKIREIQGLNESKKGEDTMRFAHKNGFLYQIKSWPPLTSDQGFCIKLQVKSLR